MLWTSTSTYECLFVCRRAPWLPNIRTRGYLTYGRYEATSAVLRGGLWPVVRREAVLKRYAALRCLWQENE
eukprot:6508703-Prymnesium_polylepis.1